MAKKSTTGGAKPKKTAAPKRKTAAKTKKAAAARPARAKSERRTGQSDFNAADALLKIVESPLVADLLAVGATAALAAITASRSGRKNDPDYRNSRALKAAGKAAAKSMGQRLTTEFDEIRSAAKTASARKGS